MKIKKTYRVGNKQKEKKIEKKNNLIKLAIDSYNGHLDPANNPLYFRARRKDATQG